MANIFDSSNDPKYSQETFVSWDSFAFKRDDLSVAFSLSSYAVKFCASQFGNSTGTVSSSRISLDAVKSGLECQITAGSTATNSWALGNISGLYLTLTALMHRNLRSLMAGVLGPNRTGLPVIPSLYGVCHRWQQMSWLNWRASRSDRFWRKSGRNESVRSRESEQTFWLTSENERSHRKELFSVAPIQMDRSMKNLALTFVKNFMPRRMLQSHRPLGYVYKKQTKEILN